MYICVQVFMGTVTVPEIIDAKKSNYETNMTLFGYSRIFHDFPLNSSPLWLCLSNLK